MGPPIKLLYTVSRVSDIKSRACHGLKFRLLMMMRRTLRIFMNVRFFGAPKLRLSVDPVSIPLFLLSAILVRRLLPGSRNPLFRFLVFVQGSTPYTWL
jgi:hypothetical protein